LENIDCGESKLFTAPHPGVAAVELPVSGLFPARGRHFSPGLKRQILPVSQWVSEETL
jgi:hypothetical protein